MEYLDLKMILLAILGMIIHLLMFVAAKTKGGNKFSITVWSQDTMNWIRLFLALTSTFAILLMLDEIALMFGVKIDGHGGLLKLVAFTSGYLNHSLIKNILKIFNKASQTSEIVKDAE